MPDRFLLISDIPPNKQTTGGLFLNEMARQLPQDSLAIFCTLHPFLGEHTLSPDVGNVPYKHVKAPYGRDRIRKIASCIGAKPAALASWGLEKIIQYIYLPRIRKQALAFGRENSVDAVWTVLQSPLMFRLAYQVARELDVPLYSYVMDPPDAWLIYNHFDRWSKRRVRRDFENCLKNSVVIGCNSWNMAEEYHRLYGTRTVAVIPSQQKSIAQPPVDTSHQSDLFVLGIAGQLYANAEWQALIEALRSVNWQIANRTIKIRLIGGMSLAISAAGIQNQNVNFEFLGWREQSETINLLQEVDACYCPYRFGEQYREEARLAFPSKLTTYLATGRPVFFHGPDYSSPGQFLEKNDAAMLCFSTKPEDILSKLESLITDLARYAELSRNGLETFKKHLTLKTQHKAIIEYLGISPAS